MLSVIAKALTAFLASAYGLYEVASKPESPGGVGVTRDEWVGILIAALVAGAAVWLVPNKSAPPAEPAPAPQDGVPGEAGADL